MDHEAYENEMIDGVNRHTKEWDQITFDSEITPTEKNRVVTKTDTRALRQGFKRMVLALFTTALFALSIFCFIVTATATGYLAVFLFFSAIVLMVWAVIFLYAQGVADVGSKGDSK